MTTRDEIQPIILDIVCRELRVKSDARTLIGESMAEDIAAQVDNVLRGRHFIRAEVDPQEVVDRIIHAIPLGNWPNGSLNLTPNEIATRIYSGLENAPTVLTRT